MNSADRPLISVVMPVYNALPFLDDSIRSILAQTFSDFEFVILDDASTDGSMAGLRRWAARSDPDRIAHPDRPTRQWKIIQQSADIVAVGTLCNGIDACGREVRPRDRWRLVRRSGYIPFPHGSAMFRREAFDKVGGYDEAAVGAEDQELFSRMAAHGRVVTLPDVLYSYRYHANNATLFNGLRAVAKNHENNGDSMAAFYMLDRKSTRLNSS